MSRATFLCLLTARSIVRTTVFPNLPVNTKRRARCLFVALSVNRWVPVSHPLGSVSGGPSRGRNREPPAHQRLTKRHLFGKVRRGLCSGSLMHGGEIVAPHWFTANAASLSSRRFAFFGRKSPCTK